MILNYKDHKKLKEILKLTKQDKDQERKILDLIKPFRYKVIDNKILNSILDHFIKWDEDWCKDYKFDEKMFVLDKHEKDISFMDYFTRKLIPSIDKKLKNQSQDCKMIVPNECHIESIGEFDKEGSPDNQILRLKKETGRAATTDLKHLDIDVKGYTYINMKLLVTFYHRIHCPISGKIAQMIPIEGTDDFFGKNSLWIVKYESDDFKHPVYHMLVGESTIQDFDFLKEKGDEVQIYDTLGFFNWGSQTILLIHNSDFDKLQIENIDTPKERHHHFVGDCLIK
jgi:phosphatidylserine decarboxylase